MVCKSCGGVLTDISFMHGGRRWRCEYCGAEYVLEGMSEEPNIIEIVPAKFDVLRARIMVDPLALLNVPEAEIDRHVKSLLVHELVDEIINLADIKTTDDISTGCKVISASVRIVRKEG